MFITFEGVEGSGKSTQIKLLKDYLEKKGQKVILTKEPGGTELGDKIRQILLDHTDETFPPIAELLLYEADRNIHIHNVIKPALEANKIVICDRFYDSTLAYQGFARGLDKKLINELNDLVVENFKPDVTFVLDIDVKKGMKRVEERGSKDRLEQEKINFHQKLRQGYLEIAEQNPSRIFVINADQVLDYLQDNKNM